MRVLADPAFYAHRPARFAHGHTPVEHIQTHISHVFLAGPYVYKLKKAVRFPFLDFSTPELRRHFCDEELRLNRRLARGAYLDVAAGRAAVRTARSRSAATARSSTTCCACAACRRTACCRRCSPPTRSTPAMMERLARRMADFHARPPSDAAVAAHASPEAVRQRWSDTIATLAPFAGHDCSRAWSTTSSPTSGRASSPRTRRCCERRQARRPHPRRARRPARRARLLRRPAGGRRRAYPEALAPGIYVFDCIEFSTAFRCNDVAAEIAFLTMDLELRGRRDLAERFARATSQPPTIRRSRRSLPFYASARACVRATVESLTSAEPEVEPDRRAAAAARARDVRDARACAAPGARTDRPLIGCMGLSGTGKSTLAAALADAVDATVLRSDVIRKRLGATSAADVAARYTPAAQGRRLRDARRRGRRGARRPVAA